MNSGYLNNVIQIARPGKGLWIMQRPGKIRYFLGLLLLVNHALFFAQNTDSLPKTQQAKVFLNGKDTMMDVILDHSYGTAEQVTQKINDGELECYYVKDHDKLYQKFRVLEKESFIEDYWVLMTCVAIVLLLVLVYFKRKPHGT